jgi:hypothetical protein
MEKEFIPYEQASALKLLGFDEPCNTCYDKLQMVSSYGKDVFDYKNYNTSGYVVSRPTFSQAFRWFRKKYKFNQIIHPNSASYFYNLFSKDDCPTLVSDDYSTYEEAELECLKKLIEIVKEK